MKVIKIHDSDSVAVAVVSITPGDIVSVGDESFSVACTIPAGHKVALCDICAGEPVIKYGYPIGTAAAHIKKGEHVHTHNLKTALSTVLSYKYTPNLHNFAPREPGVFMGYRRANGTVGVRNEVWILPTTGCVNSIAERLADIGNTLKSGSAEGVYAFCHPYGCSQLGEDHENTKKALWGLMNNPNAGAVLIVGLGCENNTLEGMMDCEYDPARVKFMNCQDVPDEFDTGRALLLELLDYASQFRREVSKSSELVIGLKCGGSDGFSGITANPLLGALTDRILSEGGSAVLTEVPEMFGAETILMSRCIDRYVFEKTVGLINGYKEYYLKNGQAVYENPSPGNKDGGISTLEEKALGCTQKCGSGNVAAVCGYGEAVTSKGLSLLSAPGNDLVSSSALAVSGASLVLFTTGRGTPFGSPVPTVKISSNSVLATAKPGWIDFDAGILLSGTGMQTCAQNLYEYVLAVASGEMYTCNERQNAREFTIFKTGVTL